MENTPTVTPTNKASFYTPVADSQREALMKEYVTYLGERNGRPDPQTGALPRREEGLRKMNEADIHWAGCMSQADFDRLYSHFSASAPGLTPEMLILLLFCKMNAGEAYGVRVVKAAKANEWAKRMDFPTQAIRFAQDEEEYHTRILVGATAHFSIKVTGAYIPKPALRLLIGGLAYAPQVMFHPILFGAETAGVYVFNWTLNRIRSFIKGQPELTEALERRLIEVLVDEIGHVALNRLLLGERGRQFGQRLSEQTVRGMPIMTPELSAIGFDDQAQRDFARFDLDQLPEEVRRRGFFA